MQLNLSVIVLTATKDDEFRKPCIGAFEYLVNQILLDIIPSNSKNDLLSYSNNETNCTKAKRWGNSLYKYNVLGGTQVIV